MPNLKQSRNTKRILDSTIQVLNETGYSSLTIETIAAHAGVGKTTIYRWWDSKAHLVLDAFLMTTATFQFDTEKSVHDNFKQQLINASVVFNTQLGRSMLAIIVENKEISELFYTSYLNLKRKDATSFLKTAIAKGEIKPDINIDILLDMLFGPIYFRTLIFNREPDHHFISELVEQVMKGILP
ncbi:TetR/AcrR family transcriptional regulator [Priestia endophytica]|uniref:TetR/AcrR family transcriptional regulator n=1 Tax=Priestia endophytica TaxID=135735 RepID=UPI00227E4880|nr:TetR/AcrR family transcriptional regulator [Priestia endophytica]MCY8231672.1 TetR/AcrR family transcriptional regulator [Priestia endophytica]